MKTQMKIEQQGRMLPTPFEYLKYFKNLEREREMSSTFTAK